MEPAELLKKYFGYDTFRPMQEDVIKTILSGRDVLAVMPTGAGKSVCFQIPALLFPHGTIIISPLISLMKDQVEALAEQGISAWVPFFDGNGGLSHKRLLIRRKVV